MDDEIGRVGMTYTVHGGYQFGSCREAEDWLAVREQWVQARIVLDDLPLLPTEEQYQDLCRQLKVPAHTDTDIMAMGTRLEHADYSPTPGGYAVAQWVEMTLARRRSRRLCRNPLLAQQIRAQSSTKEE